MTKENLRLEGLTVPEVIRWAFSTFGGEVVTATGFGPSGIVLMDHISKTVDDATVFYLETDLLFEETYELRERLVDRLGISVKPIHSGVSLWRQEQQHGPDLWSLNPDHCCFIRKMLPLRRFLADKPAWMTGIRRDQSAARAGTQILEWDLGNGLVKINPLAAWTSSEVWQYIRHHELPYNELHDRGFPSIGCMPCTQTAAEGSDSRSGRWAGFSKNECGIHLQRRVV